MTYEIALRARRRLRLLAIGAAVGAVLLIGLIVLGVGALGSDDGEGAALPEGAPPAGTAPVFVSAVVDEVGWVDAPLGQLPASPSAGPEVNGPLARGFERNELGAVMAAAHLTRRTQAAVGSDVFVPTITEQVVGPDAPEFLRAVRGSYDFVASRSGVQPGKPFAERSGFELYGYSVIDYSPDRATVALFAAAAPVNSTSTVRHVVIRGEMRWVDDDWRLVAPIDGAWQSMTGRLHQAPTAFIPFPVQEASR